MKIYKHINYLFIIIILTFSLFLSACTSEKTNSIKELLKDQLIIHYINVGQGDSQLIQYKGKNMLIDAGPISAKNSLIKYLKGASVEKLDYVIATHPHEDHIGNMYHVIKEFEIDEFIAPKVSTSSSTYKSMIKALKSKKLKITVAKAGIKINLHSNLNCELLAPNNNTYENINNYSIVTKLVYKDNSFLFTGDAENLSENEILQKNFDVKANVLKLGHHGSNTASSVVFLNKVKPTVAIISCGARNKYNHPHSETIKKLKNMNITIYRTDKDGNIVLISDGYNIKKLNK